MHSITFWGFRMRSPGDDSPTMFVENLAPVGRAWRELPTLQTVAPPTGSGGVAHPLLGKSGDERRVSVASPAVERRGMGRDAPATEPRGDPCLVTGRSVFMLLGRRTGEAHRRLLPTPFRVDPLL